MQPERIPSMVTIGGARNVQYQFDRRAILGQGSFATVYRCGDYAVKEISMANFGINRPTFDTLLGRQITIMEAVNHKNVIRLHDHFQFGSKYYIITEICQSSLAHFIRSNKLNQDNIKAFFRQILEGYEHLFSKNIVHRDLKPDNILIKYTNEGCIIKIADFGFSKQLMEITDDVISCLGTPHYMSPQVLQSQKYSYKNDIWALGVIYYEMLVGQVPWQGHSQRSLLKSMKDAHQCQKNGTEPSFLAKTNIDWADKQLILRMLSYNQKDRIQWKELASLVLYSNIATTGQPSIKTIRSPSNTVYELDEQQIIGRGNTSTVYRCHGYAIKQIDMRGFHQKQNQLLQSQLSIMERVKDEYIVRFYQYFQINDFCYIVTEYCQSDLGTYLRQGTIDDMNARKCMRLILKGYRIVHRDLKPENILIKYVNSGWTIKIADFSYSKILQNQTTLLRTALGTPLYECPQILEGHCYSRKCDTWSLGVIYFELLSGRTPWQAQSISQLLQLIKTSCGQCKSGAEPDYFAGTSIEKQDRAIISRMLEYDEQKRANWDEIYSYFNIVQQENHQKSRKRSLSGRQKTVKRVYSIQKRGTVREKQNSTKQLITDKAMKNTSQNLPPIPRINKI